MSLLKGVPNLGASLCVLREWGGIHERGCLESVTSGLRSKGWIEETYSGEGAGEGRVFDGLNVGR